MQATRSQLLSTRQFEGLLKAGDILIPGDDALPSFSASGCAGEIDRMLPYMSESDRRGLTALLGIIRFLPRILVRWILALTEKHRSFPDAVGGPLRMINIGVKGAVMTLYYSDVGEGTSIYASIGWDAKIVERQSK
jgi:hypothetical protein